MTVGQGGTAITELALPIRRRHSPGAADDQDINAPGPSGTQGKGPAEDHESSKRIRIASPDLFPCSGEILDLMEGVV
jgi:hypothetical protein